MEQVLQARSHQIPLFQIHRFAFGVKENAGDVGGELAIAPGDVTQGPVNILFRQAGAAHRGDEGIRLPDGPAIGISALPKFAIQVHEGLVGLKYRLTAFQGLGRDLQDGDGEQGAGGDFLAQEKAEQTGVGIGAELDGHLEGLLSVLSGQGGIGFEGEFPAQGKVAQKGKDF